MRLTPLGKLVGMVLVLLVAATAGAAGAVATRPHAQEWRCVVVESGQTVWDLAESSDDGDRRETVGRIVRENGLGPRPVQSGSAIWVPAEVQAAANAEDRQACSSRSG
ncbi:MAG TPA: hypothetical protein VNE62_09475 [Actinomycetota bacterium]|nr:hypothetical protein [Actinomycetota bacterium]